MTTTTAMSPSVVAKAVSGALKKDYAAFSVDASGRIYFHGEELPSEVLVLMDTEVLITCVDTVASYAQSIAHSLDE